MLNTEHSVVTYANKSYLCATVPCSQKGAQVNTRPATALPEGRIKYTKNESDRFVL